MHKTPVTEILCTQCSLNAVGDEGHFLMICPMYVAQRARITKHLNSNKNIASQTNMSKFNWLFSGGFRGGSGGSLEPPSGTKLFQFHGEIYAKAGKMLKRTPS